jgi:hypothetical protein
MAPNSLVGEYQHFWGSRCFYLLVYPALIDEMCQTLSSVAVDTVLLLLLLCYVFIAVLFRVQRKMSLFDGALVWF